MSERLPCKNSNCKGTILPTTANKTGGYCMPCLQAIKKKEYDEYIKKNRKDVNLYEGIQDKVEIIKIMNTPLKYDPLINYIKYEKSLEDIYSSITMEDVLRLKKYVLELIEEDNFDKAEDILLPLVCITNANIEECLAALTDKSHYYPGILFKDANTDTRDKLIKKLDSDLENQNHILYALSWIGDQTVVSLFNSWRKNPPIWKSKLCVNPETYSFESGWELTNNGERRNLFYNECYPFEKSEPKDSDPVIVLQKNDETCKWCGSSFITLFDFDLKNKLLDFITFNTDRLVIATCPLCACYGVLYTQIDNNGISRWCELNQKPAYLPEFKQEEEYFVIENPLRLSTCKRNAYYAAKWTLGLPSSQLGGHPSWVQDAEYPICPQCKKSMTFIGQLECADFDEYAEGIYYSFICADCNIAATNYQQT